MILIIKKVIIQFGYESEQKMSEILIALIFLLQVMLPRIILSLFLLETVYCYGYKYGGLTPCCPKSKWRPIPGVSSHVHTFSTAYDQPPGSYGAPIGKPIYGPPSHTLDVGSSFDSHGFGGLSNSLEGLTPPSLGVSTSYGAPQPTYGPPAPVYGVPFQSYGVPFKNDFSSHGFASHGIPSHGFSSHGNLLGGQLAHHKVLAVQAEEAQLPPELLNPFYKNPGLKEALAKHSWFGPGEKHVLERDTDRISRHQIWEVLNNAGLIKKRR